MMQSSSQPAARKANRLKDYLFVLLQYLLPHQLLSRGMYWLTRSEWRPLKDLLIRRVIRHYRVDMGEAADPDPASYRSFNDFFTRALRPGARPLDAAPDSVLCPADGMLSQAGRIREGRVFQAKGRGYSLVELLGGDPEWAERFGGGAFATVYLSPRDYHRVHMPAAGRLEKMIHVPGRLFSVNPVTTRLVPRLFSRNERVITLFETEAGPVAVILVGAIFVSSIDTVWAGTVVPRWCPGNWSYRHGDPINLDRGAEMGRFNMGSTVILLFPENSVTWADRLAPGTPLRMGEAIGQRRAEAT